MPTPTRDGTALADPVRFSLRRLLLGPARALKHRLDSARPYRDTALGRLWYRGREFELLHRALGFAALAFVTMVPLLIVVAALAPVHRAGFERWIVNGMGLSGDASVAVRRLFARPREVIDATSAYSAVVLAVFGVPFAGMVQTGYERIWGLPPGPWHKVWRQVLWLTALTAVLFAEIQSEVLLDDGVHQAVVRGMLAILAGTLFFWWGQHLFLAGRVSWAALLPGAVLAMVGLAGLRAFSSLVFTPLIGSGTGDHGAVDTLLVVQSWLIGVGFVVFGGPLVGCHIHHHRVRDDS